MTCNNLCLSDKTRIVILRTGVEHVNVVADGKTLYVCCNVRSVRYL